MGCLVADLPEDMNLVMPVSSGRVMDVVLMKRTVYVFPVSFIAVREKPPSFSGARTRAEVPVSKLIR